MELMNLSCEAFLEDLAGSAPAPGGGGAAALVGAAGAALGNMVGSLTVGKKKYAAVEADILILNRRAAALRKRLEGLVQADKCEGIVYNDPIVAAQEVTDLLRTKEGCDVVICLSHLGFRLKNEVCDEKLAAATRGIDVILGGHSHTFMEKPAFCLNAEGKSIPVLHTGRSGIFVGELDLTLTKE